MTAQDPSAPESTPAARAAAIDRLAAHLAALTAPHPVRVGIDGVDCSGKTTLADELAGALAPSGRPVLRVSGDGFHQPRAIRYRQGSQSPDGFFEDSFDLAAIRDKVLVPLGPGGDRRYRPAQFDVRADRTAPAPWRVAPPDAILLFDGIFLHRPALRPYWEFTIFVDVTFDTVLKRAAARDGPLFGSAAAACQMYETRYIPGQQKYLTAHRPRTFADALFDNDQLATPALSLQPGADRRRQADCAAGSRSRAAGSPNSM